LAGATLLRREAPVNGRRGPGNFARPALKWLDDR
jgi:hypothetical protein